MVACLEKTGGNAEFHEIVDFLTSSSIHYALTVNPTIYASYIEQFWNTATSKTFNPVKQIHALVDGKAVVISESSVRNDLLFDDEDGITCLTNDDIFENLALMGIQKHRRAKKITKLPQTSVPLDLGADEVVHKEGSDSVERAITTVARLVAARDNGNIIRTQTTAMHNVDIP
ncbi:hypothetical protein Tco_0070878 [Tanacetum coccineum]